MQADPDDLEFRCFPHVGGPYRSWQLVSGTGEIVLQGAMPLDTEALRIGCAAYIARIEARATARPVVLAEEPSVMADSPVATPTSASSVVIMPRSRAISWLQQPTTIQGIALLIGVLGLYFAHVIAGATFVSGLAGAALLIGIPDNTGYLHRLAAANPLQFGVPPAAKAIALMLVPLLALSACAPRASTPVVQPNYAALIGLAQTDYKEIKGNADSYCSNPAADPTACKNISTTEGATDPLVAALSATTAPTTLTAIFSNIHVIETAPLPAGWVKPQTQLDVSAALSLMTTLAPIAAQLIPLL